MTVLLDSNVWIEYLQGSKIGELARKFIENDEKLIVSTINLSEIYGFILKKKGAIEAEKAIQIILKLSFVISVNTPIALNAAKLKVENNYGLGDALVHATIIDQNSKLITFDSDFKNKENVIYIDKNN